MRYVILRDDDTNALTPVECLEKLYRPFLARGLPVNLATIPEVRADACTPDGKREGFLLGAKGTERGTLPLAANTGLTAYLRANPEFKIVQHGCHHDPFEFDLQNRAEIVRRFEHGARALRDAGVQPSSAFVAPHDKFSQLAYVEAARRFKVISSGWFEWRRIPPQWWLRYALRKIMRRHHWRAGGAVLLDHPGCLLSYTRPAESILPAIKQAISQRQLTVLVTHWWEYFRDGQPDDAFIGVLHQTAEFLGSHPDICVTTFDALAQAGQRDAIAAAALARSAPALA